ncbi:MAG: metal-dependent transcriptional regulator [Oscillospiraceae bacterium]|nr:metal-dependent transcriptional regulator [Oscillospiraceae bacterium]
MKIQKSAEDYLEAMLMLQEKHGYIRSIDIAELLGVTKPSVSYAAKRLRENGFIVMDGDSHITLTDAGLAIAKRMYERHRLLTEFFIRLGVEEETAREDACKVEHDLSEETFAAICKHAGAAQKNRPAGR